MKGNTKFAYFVSLFVLIGFPVIFLTVSLSTGNWNYLVYSLPPSFTAGFIGLMLTRQQKRKKQKHI